MATTISMQKQNGLRYLESEGRNIKAFDRLVLHLNESTGVLTAEGTYSEVATNKHDAAILQALADAPLTTSEIVSAVPGDKKEVKTAFYALVKTGRIHHVSGAGTKGNPKLYGLPVEIETCSRVPLHDVDADDNEYDESGLPVFDVDVD